MSSRRTWSAILAGGVVAVLVGCNAILGNEEGTPRAAADAATDAPVTLGDSGIVAADECKTGERRCFGVCSSLADPNVGCGSATCVACDPKNVKGAPVCKGGDAGFGCDYGACEEGSQDCDGVRANGCEANLVDKLNCGSCNRACALPTPLCARQSPTTADCVSGCPTGTQDCAGACAETATDPKNCGACGKVCQRANATAACKAGACRFECLPGFKLCGERCVSTQDPAYCLGCSPCKSYPNTSATCDSSTNTGACKYACRQGTYDCDGNLENGCESTKECSVAVLCGLNVVCGPGQQCCGSRCISANQLCLADVP